MSNQVNTEYYCYSKSMEYFESMMDEPYIEGSNKIKDLVFDILIAFEASSDSEHIKEITNQIKVFHSANQEVINEYTNGIKINKNPQKPKFNLSLEPTESSESIDTQETANEQTYSRSKLIKCAVLGLCILSGLAISAYCSNNQTCNPDEDSSDINTPTTSTPTPTGPVMTAENCFAVQEGELQLASMYRLYNTEDETQRKCAHKIWFETYPTFGTKWSEAQFEAFEKDRESGKHQFQQQNGKLFCSTVSNSY